MGGRGDGRLTHEKTGCYFLILGVDSVRTAPSISIRTRGSQCENLSTCVVLAVTAFLPFWFLPSISYVGILKVEDFGSLFDTHFKVEMAYFIIIFCVGHFRKVLVSLKSESPEPRC